MLFVRFDFDLSKTNMPITSQWKIDTMWFCRFLFYKDSAPYKQYQDLIQQFKGELNKLPEKEPSPGDIYEPEMALEDDDTRSGQPLDSTDVQVKLFALNGLIFVWKYFVCLGLFGICKRV